jgi:hypothetical protein
MCTGASSGSVIRRKVIGGAGSGPLSNGRRALGSRKEVTEEVLVAIRGNDYVERTL